MSSATATAVDRVPVVAAPTEDRPPAITRNDFARITEAVTQAAATSARAVVLHGSAGFFCAGADLADLRAQADDLDGYVATFDHCLHTVSTAGVPVVLAVDGPAIGAGFELALCAYAVVAGEGAWFCFPEAGFGLPAMSGTARLAAAVGAVRAREILLSCRRVYAAEAHDLGLVTTLVPTGQADDAAAAAAAAFPDPAPPAIAAIKQVTAVAPLPRERTRPWVARALGIS